ncbi:WD repeat containing cyclophilin family peptidyl- prolyl cis-trans isomerase Cyp9 [Schizosaccharomyces japonicus yFS275]|uniref:peptidylprolyl isomerase n=1 Tax=Schizosaccharomyces japonicus (strain yFS275 / FY16936) TaxID=402676 RepID=B6K0R1_SCHJY|nr:WD repeat containing cyclophilin family peptidyl- prolyl cis-trans isomerase Cyp9 [Schizosaccharomyces japonicus yFS275]EEB07532.2 WD repeat containing cyclophilin family peptidyl- prolyl cis-trans isomerase Cyp9 [Schizosaccharomyces japonicus yFS275]
MPESAENLQKRAALDEQVNVKRQKSNSKRALILQELPSSERYVRSYMHRDDIIDCCFTKSHFLITTSIDGHIKIWQKRMDNIEFIKDFSAHESKVILTSLSDDEKMFASCDEKGNVKVFDIQNVDMVNVLSVKFTPKALCWIRRKSAEYLLAVTDSDSPLIYIYNAESRGDVPELTVKKHAQPVHLLKYLSSFDMCISVDVGGMIEYWSLEPPHTKPDNSQLFRLKSQTDLYLFKKTKAVPINLTISPNKKLFATISQPDWQIRVFDLLSGKVVQCYDESLPTIEKLVKEAEEDPNNSYHMNHVELGRRMVVEVDIRRAALTSNLNVVFDETSQLISYGSFIGIKIASVYKHELLRILGKEDGLRFTRLSLYQEAPEKSIATNFDVVSSNNPLFIKSLQKDPVLAACAWKKSRFYLFSSKHLKTLADRDAFNETLHAHASLTAATKKKPVILGKAAILHTTEGDISIKLLPDDAPKAVENFTTHALNGYYDNTIFHRVIKNFMIQGGDPEGDGTGGESIWGEEFEDEFSDRLKHDRPYTVSMANAGPNTNGSQFFITTTLTPWLDGKHTIFARAYAGMDVIHRIEDAETDKYDRPLQPVKIINITIVK